METKASGTTLGHADSSYRSWLSAVPLLRLHRRVKDRLPVRVGLKSGGLWRHLSRYRLQDLQMNSYIFGPSGFRCLDLIIFCLGMENRSRWS